MTEQKEIRKLFSLESLLNPPLKAASMNEVKIEKSTTPELDEAVVLLKEEYIKNSHPFFPTQSVPSGLFRVFN